MNKGWLVFVALGISGVAPAQQNIAIAKTESMDFPAGGVLHLRHSLGEVFVEGWDQPGIEITITESPLVRGLAIWSGREAIPPAGGGRHTEGDLLALAADDLAGLDRDWFGPLFAQVKSGGLKGLDIHLEGLGDFDLSSAAARRFWRFSKPVMP